MRLASVARRICLSCATAPVLQYLMRFLCWQVFVLLLMPCCALVHTSAALDKVRTHKAKEPITRLIAALVLGNVECVQRVTHPLAVMSLSVEVMASTSIEQLTHRYAEERCVLLQRFVALV